jgi:PmbA protein
VSAAGIAAVVRSARALALRAPPEPGFRGFARATGGAPRPVAFSSSTAALPPEEVTRLAERILDATHARLPAGRTAGAVHVGAQSLRVVNSTGLDRSTRVSSAEASVLVDRPDRDPPVSGWSEGAHWDVARLDPARLGQEAAERVARSAPRAVAPGEYRVVLRGPAMSDLVSFLALLGFGAHGEIEGWSCLRGRRGARVAPARISLVDDARSEEGIPRAIDYEGTLTRRRPLLDRGVAGAPVTDLVTAGKLKARLTGHAPPPEAPWGEWGPYPMHLDLAAGDATEEELVRATRRGLLVTRFHYVRVVDPSTATITGMTRDGTYRIERGEVAGPVRNLRFTQSVLGALASAELLGRERRAYADERGGSSATVPAALLGRFRFTSATVF